MAQLPKVLAEKGFMSVEQMIARRGIMIGTEGPSDSGKSEFWLSAPPPIGAVCLDRMVDGALRNANPPKTRTDLNQVYLKIVKTPLPTTGKEFINAVEPPEQFKKNQEIYEEYWSKFRRDLYYTLDYPFFRTVVIDGDSDSYKLQRLAAFGKLSKIMPVNYEDVNNARKAIYSKCWDSGKIVIATNKVKESWVDKMKPDGTPDVDEHTGKVRQTRSGEFYNEGFPDIEYLWHIRLKHFYEEPIVEETVLESGPRKGQTIRRTIREGRWGCEIIKCKPRKMIEGIKLYGEDCTFAGVMRVSLPQIPLSFWGL